MRVRPRPNGKFLTLRDAEKEYGIAYARLREWIMEGKLPRLNSNVVGRALIVSRESLDRFLSANNTTVAQ
jgi:hypothetical protein